MFSIQDQVIVITGAGGGIGCTMAQAFLTAGAKLVATDLDLAAVEATIAEADAGRAIAVQQDVTDPASMAAVLERAHETFGRVDAVVNNAGVAQQKPYDQVSERDWDLQLDVNAKGVFFACQAAGNYFREHGAGRIVNMASFVGKTAIPEYGPYNASKAAVIAITQTFAHELGPDGVNVNAICPGVVRTPMWDKLDPQQWDRQVAKIPLGRGQEMGDIASAAIFLLSDGASSITGATLPVTGGLAMW